MRRNQKDIVDGVSLRPQLVGHESSSHAHLRHQQIALHRHP
jgi:hypothetical protein